MSSCRVSEPRGSSRAEVRMNTAIPPRRMHPAARVILLRKRPDSGSANDLTGTRDVQEAFVFGRPALFIRRRCGAFGDRR